MYIDKKSPIPAYYQLKKILLEKIKSGEYAAGSLIPSERELCETLGISRMTVRQALNQLVSEGILYREKGRGTFVSKAKLEQRNLMSFSEMAREKGLEPITKVLHFSMGNIIQDICDVLDLGENETVYHIKRLRLVGSVPVGIEESYIPQKYCPGLDRYDLTTSLYRLMKDEYQHAISYADNVIEAAKATKEEKELLEITESKPVLKIVSVNFTESGLKLLYERSVYRSDEYKYSVRVYGNRDTD
ncbi:GntR family transcriptional regulator [Clostridium thermosuccinogenes]|jgi:GntR family transcriptional regulator|uniref:GntR family transcriptional regulator n=1 Tax=Clostridium thermosuccinogenes TaxID=84032 RepID=A0A2K2F5W0_9CLOT|nr:GntR family transcriptional regulator [Pseudoclostridium thermosuccinogenes]AUS97885.1 GntR family transcriptional regulator [Pseudoclostridium thermosuccinogenes]PNT94171.1 GntR family transcriptional regulator [Pseudoclostridium thermosuccinogenes]PNU00182.1 GntR family transcriptional regulator [Pseudoclostridium thermosuccinogenes]PNU01506.1 GntR family transcriptional regulator [Pseudoclostridium thermosuccinogenes]